MGIFREKKTDLRDIVFSVPPREPKEVQRIKEMLYQVTTWMNSGENELAQKHWILISDECKKISEQK